MPTYDYRCTQCNLQFEARHSMTDNSPECPECGAETRKIFLLPPATHGYMAVGREQAMRSLQPAADQKQHVHGPGCGCGQHHSA